MTDQTPSQMPGLRDQLVNALGQIETIPPVAHRRAQADNVLAVLYREWPWLRAAAEESGPAPGRKTASTINDTELDQLYAENDRLRALLDAEQRTLAEVDQRCDRYAAELAALRVVSRGYCPECGRGDAAPTVADWEQQRQRADEAEQRLRRIADGHPRADAIQAEIGEMIAQTHELREQLARAEAELRRYTEAESADAAAGSYAGRAEQAEAFVAFVADTIADHEGDEWANHPATTTIRAAFPALAHRVWTPPPPGSTREQLPDRLLVLIDIPAYTSTACDTAARLAWTARAHTHSRTELGEWADRLHARCRRNQKFTGALCICACHETEETAMPPAPDDTDLTEADVDRMMADSTPAELTAQEARDLADQLGRDLYRAEDRLAFIAELLDAAEQDGTTTVDIARVRGWLDGPKCGMRLAAENPGLYDKLTSLLSGPLPPPALTPAVALGCSVHQLRRPHGAHEWQPQPGMRHVQCPGYAQVPAQHRFTAAPVTPEMEHAATERARQAAAESERSAAWFAATGGAMANPAATEATDRATRLDALARDILSTFVATRDSTGMHVTHHQALVLPHEWQQWQDALDATKEH